MLIAAKECPFAYSSAAQNASLSIIVHAILMYSNAQAGSHIPCGNASVFPAVL